MSSHYKPWSETDEATLRKMWADPAVTQEDMHERLGRSVNAIREHAKVYMKLPTRQATPSRAAKFWIGERDAILEREFKAGKTFTEIAAIIGGCSRNACIGRASRIGLTRSLNKWSPNKKPQPVRATPKPKASSPKPRLTVVGNNTVIEHVQRPALSATKADAWAPLEGSKPRPFWECGIDFCSWPVEVEGAEPGIMRCCLQAERGAYCAGHGSRGYQAPKAPGPRATSELLRSVRRYA